MTVHNIPTPGNRYQTPDRQTFTITGLDETAQIITITFPDGSTETLDVGMWYKLAPAPLDTGHTTPQPASGAIADAGDHASLGVAPGTEGLPEYRLGDDSVN